VLEALTPRSDVPCNLSWSTNKLQTLVLFVSLMFLLLYSCAGMAELADAADSKSLLPPRNIPIETVIS